jgi:D-alanyl-lipoteichoic acid acyltransferase DltB (MBOAT superfamily)
LLNQLTYSGLLLDGHPHLWVDLPIAAVAYYLYLYCNFSGFCDIAIGGAGLMGIPVAENFANPFAARNMKDFWNRWHITLSQYMRDVVFSPLSKTLVRVVGPSRANHAIAATILVVFLLVGIWHGVTWNYAAFGVACGVGVAANHYYTVALKKRLGRERFAAYNRSRAIHAAAVTTTFLYVSASLFLFANDWDAMKTIVSRLRVH